MYSSAPGSYSLPYTSEPPPVDSLPKESERVLLKTILNRPDGGAALIGQTVVVGGWVNFARSETPPATPPDDVTKGQRRHKRGVFRVGSLKIKLPFFRSSKEKDRDQDCPPPPERPNIPAEPSIAILQVTDASLLRILVDSTVAPTSHMTRIGMSILVEGILQKPSWLQDKEVFEIKAEKVKIIDENYPVRYRGDF